MPAVGRKKVTHAVEKWWRRRGPLRATTLSPPSLQGRFRPTCWGGAPLGCPGEERSMFRKIPWQEVCKFLAGAFFVNAGVLFYLYLAGVSVPLLGTSFVETPEISGARSIVHGVLFVAFFYLGFIR
jgi:hypothetical protein